MRAFIERIDIYPEKPDNGCWIRNIVFNFPMPVHGQEIKSLPLESESTVETCVLLSHQQVDKYKTVDYTPDGSYMKDVNRHATYKEINEYVE